MKKNRRLMLVALLLLAIVSIGASFAYWAVVDLNDTIENNTITIGTGVSSVVSASTEDQTEGVLVPVGQAENSIEANAVEFVIFTFEVVWATNTLDDPTGTVAALIENLTLTGADSSDLSGLVNTTIQIGGTADLGTGVLNGDGNNAITANDDPVTVYVLVTLDEPDTEAEALAVFGQPITFDIEFTVTED